MNSVKKIGIIQSNYIPWKGYFDIINMVDEFVIYDEVQYTKNDWRNRNLIKSKNGVVWITIPVRQNSLDQKIYDTKIAKKDWNIKHWKTIKTVYSKAPYFEKYYNVFEQIYFSATSEYLTEINQFFIKEINKILDIPTKITDSRELNLQGNLNERLVDAILKLKGSVYLSGPAAKGYLDASMFSANNISIEWMNYSNYPEYKQMYLPFEHSVSILDLIFNKGPDAKKFMKSF
jgi:hypothetical protein